MSKKNVEIVRRVYDAVARGDSASILALYDPGIELRAAPGTLGDRIAGGVYRGHDGLRAFDRELREAFENIETYCEELIDAGEQVVSASRYRARGRGSGVEVDGPVQFGVWTIRDGKVLRVVWFGSREEALEPPGSRSRSPRDRAGLSKSET
jgi:ketosteroid isomerase-like protein